MLNIKDCGFGYPRTFKNILDYDKHTDKYKSENNVVKDDQKYNFCLVDNTAKFEQNLKQYHKDLYFANKQNRNLNRKKTNSQIEKDFYETKIMRTFRIQVNSVELKKINQGILDTEKIRQNTTAFYQKTLDQAIAILDHENVQKRQPLMLVKADVHFDQTNPHIHIHLSNFYEKKVKENYKDQEYKKTVITNNIEQTDLIKRLDNISKKFQKEKQIKVSPNEIFTRLLNQNNNNQYLFLNRLHLKTVYPKFFSLYESNSFKKFNVDFKNLSQKEIQKQISQIKGK